MSRRREHERDRVDGRPHLYMGKVPPHDDDAEAAVLSAVLSCGEAYDEVAEHLHEGRAFYVDANRRIWEVIIELRAEGTPVDIQTVAARLKLRDRLQSVGGVAYIAKIVDATPAVAHVEAHARIVREKYRIRSLIEQCQMTAAEGFGDYGNAQEFIGGHEQKVFALASLDLRSDLVPMSTIAESAHQMVQRAHEGPGGVTGYPTGFDVVDEQLGGYHPSELVIIGARPGMGKTAYVLSVAMHQAKLPPFEKLSADGKRDEGHDGYLAAIFELEMPKEQLCMRGACVNSGFDLSSVRKGRLGSKYGAYLQHLEVMKSLPIYIDDSSDITLTDIRAKLRRLARRFPRKKLIAYVDYLQLMRSPPDADSREEAVSSITRGLKALAKELYIPVVAITQLNRKCEERGKDRRPQLADMRESGAIEQDADVVQFLFRPSYYRVQANEEIPADEDGYAEVITAKQRNGPTGALVLAFREKSTRFENATVDDHVKWGSSPSNEPQQEKMFAPNSKLPGAPTAKK